MRFRLLLLFLLAGVALHAQSLDSLVEKQALLDSIRLRDPLDSLQHSFYSRADSLKQSYRNSFASMDSSSAGIRKKIDSLQSLQLPVDRYTAKLDSIQQKREQAVSSLNQKVEALKTKSLGKIKQLDLPDDVQSKVSSVTQNIEGFKLPVKDLNIPSLDMPGNPLKGLDGLTSSIQSPTGIGQLDGLKGVEGLKDVTGQLGDVSKITDQAGEIGKDLKAITDGNLGDVQQLPGTLEGKAGELAGVDKLTDATKALDPMKDYADKVKDPGAAKEEVIKQAKQVAVNHFAGKEEQLKAAMDKMSKLKQKYSSLNSLSEATKKRPNEMRGKPLIERLIPGIALQVGKKADDLMVDFNPYVGYRLSGRLTSGIGWNHRVAYNTDWDRFNSKPRIYGPRVYGEYKLGKGFAPRLEAELMNTLVPPITTVPKPDGGQRQWVPGIFTGLKKEFRFTKNVKGTSLIMLRTWSPRFKSPYADIVNVRIGFEFQLKKRVKKPAPDPATSTEK